MAISHSSNSHECPPYAVDEQHCEMLTELGEYDYYAESLPPREPEDALFWVPHQQRLGELVEFDRFTSTIDDIIAGCGYREEDRGWLTDIHRASTVRFMECYQGPTNGWVPLLGDE